MLKSRNYFRTINCELFQHFADLSSSDLKLSIKINCSMNFYAFLLRKQCSLVLKWTKECEFHFIANSMWPDKIYLKTSGNSINIHVNGGLEHTLVLIIHLCFEQIERNHKLFIKPLPSTDGSWPCFR